MKKQIPTILLTVVSIALAIALHSANQQIAQRKQQVAMPQSACVADKQSSPNEPTEIVKTTPDSTLTAKKKQPPELVPEKEEAPSDQRMMKNIAKMLDNPAMNKMMEASQRGVIGAMYEDLIADLNMTEGEEKYFMELLLFRQMTQVDVGMKMMSVELSDEEKKSLGDKMKETIELVKTEMEAFLNDEDDYNEFKFFEKTMAERMMLSQAEASLNGTTEELSDGIYRELLEMMHDEKKNFNFNTNLTDEENMDMSSERFSKANTESFETDMDQLNEKMFTKAQSILSEGQLTAFKDAVKTTTEMQKSQMQMAAQMMGGDK